jgi:hypothetical protein
MKTKHLYRVEFTGQLNGSIGLNTNYLQKILVFDEPKKYDDIVLKLYETHQHIRVKKITDLSAASAFNEIKPTTT